MLSFGKNRKIEKKIKENKILFLYIYLFIYFGGTFQTFNFSPGTNNHAAATTEACSFGVQQMN